MAYTMNDYRNALNERESKEFESAEWNEAQQKVKQIIEELVKAGNREMVLEIVEEIYSLAECGFDVEEPEIKEDLELLEKYGYHDKVQEIKEELM